MKRNINKSAILWLLISSVVLTPVCTLVESSPAPVLATLTKDTTTASAPADVSPTLLTTQTTTAAPRVSISFNDESSRTLALSKELSPNHKTSRRPDLDFWYGEYFTDHKLPRLGASPLESEPSRLGVKLSFSF